jgi:hypothetical protein
MPARIRVAREFGAIGGEKRWEGKGKKLSPSERKTSAEKAAAARWQKWQLLLISRFRRWKPANANQSRLEFAGVGGIIEGASS